MERVFDSDPRTYRHGHQKINKALDYVDKPLMTLWYTYRGQQKDNPDIKKWDKFLEWTKVKIQGGQNVTAIIHQRFEAARHKPDESPTYFDSYLSSLERDLPVKDDQSSALSFFSKLSPELR